MSIVIVIGGLLWALRCATAKAALLAGFVVGIALGTLLVLEHDAGNPPLLIYLSSLLGTVPLLWAIHTLQGIASRILLIVIGAYVLLMGGPILVVRLWTH